MNGTRAQIAPPRVEIKTALDAEGWRAYAIAALSRGSTPQEAERVADTMLAAEKERYKLGP